MDKSIVQKAWDKYKRKAKIGKGLCKLSFTDNGFIIGVTDTDWVNCYLPDYDWSLTLEIACDEGFQVEGYEHTSMERDDDKGRTRLYYERVE